jgi:hypothetical protein
MELKLERTKLKIDLYGEIIEASKPTYGEVEALERELKEAKEDQPKITAVVKGFLGRSGIDASKVEVEHLFQIIELITGKKKN